MKRTVKIIALLVWLCVLLSGCDAWMGGEYISVTPHEARSEPYADRVIEVTSYTQLRNAITNLVRTGAENGVISISAFNQGTIHFYVDTAISNVIENTAFGAYAVEKITYEIGTNRGTSVVACRIHYRPGNQLPNKIAKIESVGQFEEMIKKALDEGDASVLVYMEQYEKLNIEEIVDSYAKLFPDRVVEIPVVKVEFYPEKGAERIVQVCFNYQTDAILMHQKRSAIEDAFRAAELSVNNISDPAAICEQLYLYLMGKTEIKEIQGTMPAYDVLVREVGDRESLAVVYARMCNRAGLSCSVVSGTRDGKPWTWNVVRLRDKDYLVDLLHSYESQTFLLNRADQVFGYIPEK